MRRRGILVVAAAGVAMWLAAGARADYTRYFGPAILWPAGGAASAYDWPCNRWVSNEMTRNISSVGTVTFIDGGGRWHFTETSGGTDTLTAVAYSADWSKKAYCYNSWFSWYWANCWRGGAVASSCNPV
jgi:hypothetical protein